MKLRNQFLKYKMFSKEGEGEGEGEGESTGAGGGGGGADQTAEIEALKLSVSKLEAKNTELLTEKKTANQARTDAEAAVIKATEEAATKAGDFESLFKSSQEKLAAKEEQFTALNGKIAESSVKSEALKLAAELADGHNVGLLADILKGRLRHTNEGIAVTNTAGELTVSTLGDLAKEFKGNEVYASLLKGNSSSGGGATGGSSGGATEQTLDRAELNKLDPQAKAEYFRKLREKK